MGRPPRRARIKGLYVGLKLFAKQLAELQAARFSTAQFQAVTARDTNQQRRVFLTFDDGFRDVFENALPVLQPGFAMESYFALPPRELLE